MIGSNENGFVNIDGYIRYVKLLLYGSYLPYVLEQAYVARVKVKT
jgi:hypothetical protein